MNGTQIWHDRRWVAKLGRVPLCKQTLRQRFVCKKFLGNSFAPNSVKEVGWAEGESNLYCVEVVTGVLANPVGALKPEWPFKLFIINQGAKSLRPVIECGQSQARGMISQCDHFSERNFRLNELSTLFSFKLTHENKEVFTSKIRIGGQKSLCCFVCCYLL